MVKSTGKLIMILAIIMALFVVLLLISAMIVGTASVQEVTVSIAILVVTVAFVKIFWK